MLAQRGGVLIENLAMSSLNALDLGHVRPNETKLLPASGLSVLAPL
jgi:hypothetical protein